jgi:hypothetical protein
MFKQALSFPRKYHTYHVDWQQRSGDWDQFPSNFEAENLGDRVATTNNVVPLFGHGIPLDEELLAGGNSGNGSSSKVM